MFACERQTGDRPHHVAAVGPREQSSAFYCHVKNVIGDDVQRLCEVVREAADFLVAGEVAVFLEVEEDRPQALGKACPVWRRKSPEERIL